MRLADRHGRPLSQVLAEYPEWEIGFWRVWMAREPSPGQRVEHVNAQIAAIYRNTHLKKGARSSKPMDFMIPDYWAQQDEKSDCDALIGIFSDAGCQVKFKEPEPEYRTLDDD